jgi:hypothetical protein
MPNPIDELYGHLPEDQRPVGVRMMEGGTRIELWKYIHNFRLMRVDDGLAILDQW